MEHFGVHSLLARGPVGSVVVGVPVPRVLLLFRWCPRVVPLLSGLSCCPGVAKLVELCVRVSVCVSVQIVLVA